MLKRSILFQFVSFLCLCIVGCAPIATSIGTTPTSAPTQTAAPVPVQMEEELSSTSTPPPDVMVGIVDVDLLNVREGPGTSYPILASLNRGEKFYVLGEVVNSTNNKWLIITPSGGGVLGWVIGDQTYITLQSEAIDSNAYGTWQQNMSSAQSAILALTPTPR